MPRRPKTSPAEDLIHLASALPWWVCVVLAITSYLVFHAIASRPLVLEAGGNPSALFGPALWRGLATAAQYIAPIVLMAAAVLSFFKRRARAALVASVNQPEPSQAIDGLSWREFEALVSEAYRKRGYRVEERGGVGPDGGIDLVLTRADNGREKVLVQCKHWRAYRVGVDVIRELYGVMAAKGATAGIVVTSGKFTAEASAFASGRNVTLLDGPRLLELIGPIARATDPAPNGQPSVPLCPSCGQPMARRVAKRGTNTGAAFWGCSNYPACRGTRPIP